MERVWTADNQWPNRLPKRWAQALVVLALLVLGLGALGLFLYDGLHRVAYVTAFAAMGLGNLALAAGSLLPSERGRRMALAAVGQLAIVMSLALGATLAFQAGCGS